MGEVGDAYAGCRAHISELTATLDDAQSAARVPTCSQWSVHDVVAHVTGVVDDSLAGRLDGVATEPWTAAQVEARRDRPIAEILAEWDSKAPVFESLLDDIGDPGRQAVADVVAHEHDIRTALGTPGGRDSDAVRIGTDFLVAGFIDSAASHGVSVRVRIIEGGEFGPSDSDVALSGERFELLRAITGRRSVDQLGAMSWEGDPTGVMPAFTSGPFHPSAQRIDE